MLLEEKLYQPTEIADSTDKVISRELDSALLHDTEGKKTLKHQAHLTRLVALLFILSGK